MYSYFNCSWFQDYPYLRTYFGLGDSECLESNSFLVEHVARVHRLLDDAINMIEVNIFSLLVYRNVLNMRSDAFMTF